MTGSQLDRRKILSLLEEERQLIIDRYRTANGIAESLSPDHGVRWYLDISKQWGVHHLHELGRVAPGRLLDIGAYYGLIAGVANRIGWRVAAVDAYPIPEFSSLRIPERNVECAIYNACTDTLPFPDESFDAVLLSEVLEHLMYSPLPMFREIRRVLRPGGILLLSTPNPAGLGKLIGLARGRAMLEPHIEQLLAEDQAYEHKGLTFLRNNRESKIWTVGEIEKTYRQAFLLRQHRADGTIVDSRAMVDAAEVGTYSSHQLMADRRRQHLRQGDEGLIRRPSSNGELFVAFVAHDAEEQRAVGRWAAEQAVQIVG